MFKNKSVNKIQLSIDRPMSPPLKSSATTKFITTLQPVRKNFKQNITSINSSPKLTLLPKPAPTSCIASPSTLENSIVYTRNPKEKKLKMAKS